MINIEWKENENGKSKRKYENLLSENSVEYFVKELENRGCTDIEIEEITL